MRLSLLPGPAVTVLVALALAGCVSQQTTQSFGYAGAAATEGAADGAIVHTTCKTNIVTTRDDALVAERTVPGHTHYVEFRLRPSPVLPSGHMFVVYGELDADGVPRTFSYTGLYPKGAVVGLYTGIVLPVSLPADLEPSYLDCSVMPSSAYRRSLTAEQYAGLLAKVARYKADPPKWAMLSNNCNHYAASLAVAAGLKAPQGTRSLEFLSAQYFGELVRANGDVIDDRRGTTETASR